jgi:hypothetical protein
MLKNRIYIIRIFFYFYSFFLFPACFAATSIGIETGLFTNPYNKQKIPVDEGTLFDISPDANEFIFYHRLSYKHLFKGRTGLRLLYAPLSFHTTKYFKQEINFKGSHFNPDEKVNSFYKFNSYRTTYFYQVVKSKRFQLNFGGTVKVRDAKVMLQQGDNKKFEENVGLVPLFYLFSAYQFNNGLHLVFDFDGLIAPQGRAFDSALWFGYKFTNFFRANLGYRILEGGADNKKVYNSSLFHYLFSSFELFF